MAQQRYVKDGIMDIPRYVHDCKACRFLGYFNYNGPLSDGTTMPLEADLYYCPRDLLGGTVLARHSDDGPDYASMPMDVISQHAESMRKQPSTHGPALLECLDRALEWKKENAT